MAASMTGFGRGEASSGTQKFIVEIRSVNHRYCDVAIKMPRVFSALEERLRRLVSQKLRRGKIDVFINCETYGEREYKITADTGLAGAYIEAAQKLKSLFNLKDDITLAALLRLPDVFRADAGEPDEEEVWKHMGDAAQIAMDALIGMREREGAKLICDIKDKIASLKLLLDRIEARAPFIVTDYRERLNARLIELLGQNIPDENRVASEVAIFADRCNIDEEITRFRSHLEQAGICCDSCEPVGRKLDFILQEINREVNTIGSKANDLAIGETVVEIKSEAEKIREQIQNLE